MALPALAALLGDQIGEVISGGPTVSGVYEGETTIVQPKVIAPLNLGEIINPLIGDTESGGLGFAGYTNVDPTSGFIPLLSSGGSTRVSGGTNYTIPLIIGAAIIGALILMRKRRG